MAVAPCSLAFDSPATVSSHWQLRARAQHGSPRPLGEGQRPRPSNEERGSLSRMAGNGDKGRIRCTSPSRAA